MKTLFKSTLSFWNISKKLKHNFVTSGILFIRFIFCFMYWKTISHKTYKFTFNYSNKNFIFFANNRVDIAALDEIFVQKEYEFNYIGDPEVIIDLGANIGDTAIFYSLKFPNARIFAVEPNPLVHEKLEKNTKQFPNIVVCKCAVSDTTGKINLNFGDSHLGSSINSREQNKNSVEVDVCSLKDFCQINNIAKIDILKFDIEGAEEYLLKDSEFINTSVVQMVGEMHDDLVTSPIKSLLSDLKLNNTEVKILNSKRYILYGKIA
jgi:FkbM family methyltransferase